MKEGRGERRKAGRKEGRSEGRKEGRKGGRRKEGRKEEGGKEGRNMVIRQYGSYNKYLYSTNNCQETVIVHGTSVRKKQRDEM